MLKTCKHCGQIIPPDARQWFRGAPVKQRIYDFVSRHPEGVSACQIADAIYADDPDGGSDARSVHVHVARMNPILIDHGIAIRGRRGPGGSYSLVKL